jgi:hypothetical protein
MCHSTIFQRENDTSSRRYIDRNQNRFATDLSCCPANSRCKLCANSCTTPRQCVGRVGKTRETNRKVTSSAGPLHSDCHAPTNLDVSQHDCVVCVGETEAGATVHLHRCQRGCPARRGWIGVGIFPRRMIEAYRPSGALAVLATRPMLTAGHVYLAHHVTADADRIEAIMQITESVTADLNYFDVAANGRNPPRKRVARRR